MNNSEAISKQLEDLIQSCGATHSAPIEISQIVFAEELRDMCAMNSCGHYGKCWICPPAIGPVSEWREKIQRFARGVMIQTVCQLEDSLDYEGMIAAKEQHTKNMRCIWEEVRNRFHFDNLLILSAGACELCKTCTYPDAPCRFPEKALVSVEACGIDVNKTLVNCGLHYNNGPDTISYVGMILF